MPAAAGRLDTTGRLEGRSRRATLLDALARAHAQPWCQPWRPALTALRRSLAAGDSVAQALNRWHGAIPNAAQASQGGPPQFVAQAELPAGEAYEAFIRRTARVPTRDNLHDLFNGLQWGIQPRLKARLNALQAGEIARAGVCARRGPLRDALTLMDENGALLDAPAPLWQALRSRDWRRLFVTHRAAWSEARLVIVGHALLEQLSVAPRKGLTAHVLDAADPLALDEAGWAAKPFCPLPVLGVPGWWPANGDEGFYEDASVFRPARPGFMPRADRLADGLANRLADRPAE